MIIRSFILALVETQNSRELVYYKFFSYLSRQWWDLVS